VQDPIFIPSGSGQAGRHRYHATELARGPWDPESQHGGAPAALLMHALDELPGREQLELARITYEFMRPVPLGDLDVHAEVVRDGRRVQMLEASVHRPDGTEVVRARALRVQRAQDVPPEAASTVPPPPPPPEDGTESDFPVRGGPMFSTHAMEIRFVQGGFHETGPATAWFRLRHPLLAGLEPTALERLAAAGDFGNGIASQVSWEEYVFINPDLTLYIERDPAGEWIGLESSMRIGAAGVGLAESVVFDRRGRVGRALQSLVIARR
jgi:Thioesterase-like superfamily